MSEQGIIQQAVSGDLNAFNQLVLIYQDVVYRHAYCLVHDPDQAADVAQDVFIKAYQHISRFRGGSFKAWILRITTNHALDDLRRQKRRPQVPLNNVSEDDEEYESPAWLADVSGLPEEVIEQRAFLRDVKRALAALPLNFRLILHLVDIEGLDYHEAAEAAGVPLGTVKSRLLRARVMLRDRLAGYNSDYDETSQESSPGRDDRSAPVQPGAAPADPEPAAVLSGDLHYRARGD